MLQLQINGQPRTLDTTASTLDQILTLLELRADRIAVEHKGEIVPRTLWPETSIANNDRLEIVHFVGGGAPEKSGSLKLIFKNLSAIFTSNVISILTELLLPGLFITYYGKELYATWIVISSAVSYLQTLNFGLQTYVNQDLAVRYNRGELEGFHVRQSTVLRALLGATFFAAIACLLIFVLPFERILNLSLSHLAASWALYFTALQVLIGALIFSYFSGAFMGVGLAHRGNYWNNAQRFANAAVLCLLAFFHQPLQVLAFSQFAVYMVMLLGLLIDLKRQAPTIFPTLRYWDREGFVAILLPSFYFGLLQWSNFFGYELPLVLLLKFAGPLPVVIFNQGRKVFSFGRQILTGLSQSLGPEITRTFGQNDWPKLYKLYDYSERVIFATIASVNVPIFFFSPILMALWLRKPGFFEINTFLLLGLTAAVICVKEHKIQFQYSTNTHEALARIHFFGYMAMCAVSVGTIHYFKLIGLVSTWLATEIVMTLAVVHLNQRLFADFEKLSTVYLAKLTALCAAGFAMAYAVLHRAESAQWNLLYRVSAGAIVSLAVIGASYYLFHISMLSEYLKQKLQAKFGRTKSIPSA